MFATGSLPGSPNFVGISKVFQPCKRTVCLGMTPRLPMQLMLKTSMVSLCQFQLLPVKDSLELAFSLEYTNSKAKEGETMMVKVAIAKTLVREENKSGLALVAVQFQEYVNHNWIDITADVEYTETAEEVVEAVLQDPNAG